MDASRLELGFLLDKSRLPGCQTRLTFTSTARTSWSQPNIQQERKGEQGALIHLEISIEPSRPCYWTKVLIWLILRHSDFVMAVTMQGKITPLSRSAARPLDHISSESASQIRISSDKLQIPQTVKRAPDVTISPASLLTDLPCRERAG